MKMMLIGSVGCGKTTLTQRLRGNELSYDKTQAVEFHEKIIDTPGEFIQHRNYYSALMTTAAEAQLIVLVMSGIERNQTFAPLFAKAFNKPCIGIITKIDLASRQEIQRVEKQLNLAGATKLFEVSAVKNLGIEELQSYLKREEEE